MSYLYHVTSTKNVSKIKKKGILQLQQSNWVKGDQSRYGEGEIFAFEHPGDAAKWAAKMDWSFNRKMGTGKISVIRIKKTGDWKEDTADPLSQAGKKGKWLKKQGSVEPGDIMDSVPITLTITRRLVADDDLSNLFSESKAARVVKMIEEGECSL